MKTVTMQKNVQDKRVNYSITLPRALVEHARILVGTDFDIDLIPKEPKLGLDDAFFIAVPRKPLDYDRIEEVLDDIIWLEDRTMSLSLGDEILLRRLIELRDDYYTVLNHVDPESCPLCGHDFGSRHEDAYIRSEYLDLEVDVHLHCYQVADINLLMLLEDAEDLGDPAQD